jgi:hypothetical protein
MKRSLFLVSAVGVVLMLAVGLSARDRDLSTKGKAWLDAHNEPATINVNGDWQAKSWGKVVLNQAQGSRDLAGRSGDWDISGVVSGKQVFLLFSYQDKVNYSAELTSESETSLNGSYSKGFMSEKTKGRSMHLTKQ